MSAKPLTLVGGYLGSGKTTLINRLLTSPDAARTAIVVNDFGDVNVDAALIRSSGADTLELTNGCICCQITDDVQRTMAGLAERSDIDRVICEVSGIGDPSQLGTWRTYPGFRAGPIIVCADARATPARLRNEYVADVVESQLAAADAVLVTKAGVLPAAEVARVAELCAQYAGPDARIHVLADETADELLALLREGGGSESVRSWLARSGPDAPEVAGPGTEATGSGTAAADSVAGDSTVASLAADNEVMASSLGHADVHVSAMVALSAETRLPAVIGTLTEHAESLVRAKGFVQDDAGCWHAVHLAGGVVESTPLGDQAAADARAELVLIAAGPDARAGLDRVAAAFALTG